MSVKAVTYWTVICDRCGKDGNADGEHTAWSDVTSAVGVATYWDDWLIQDWFITGDVKHYCPDCWEWSEDEDGRVPKPPVGVRP